MRWPNGSQTMPNVSSAFGPRTAPTNGASSIHRGTDFTGVGQVRAIASGRVVVTGTPSGWSGGGRQVWIQHDGFFTRSMHLASWSVSNGQWVDEGTIIGVQDTTGTATGSHLHLEVTPGNLHYSNTGQVDPVPFIRARLSTTGGSGDTAQLQLDLNTIGYPLEVDNDYGPATKAAVTQFQKDNGLTADGIAGPNTKAKLLEKVKGLQTAFNSIGYTLVVDGYSGPATVGAVKDFQGKNGLEADGCVGPKTWAKLNEKLAQPTGYNAIPNERSTADIQRLVGATPDGVYGPDTTAKVSAWQSSKGLKADGIWGPESDKIGFPPTPAAFIPVVVDGIWGKGTTTALQANLGIIASLPADQVGVLNSATIKALQTAIGLTGSDVDGELGPKTSKYLQSSLGVAIDGQIGPLTVTALQTLLNRSGKLQYVPFKEEEQQPVKTYPKPAAPTYPAAIKWDHSPNCSVREGKVQLAILHHWGTDPIPTPQSTWDRFMRPNDRSVSPNVQINNDGTVYEPVPSDGYRAWTTGAVDHQAVTAEVQNSTVGPSWLISDKAFEAIAQWLAWASKRYNFPLQRGEVKLVDGVNVVTKPGVIGHNETPAGKSTGTTCPGGMNIDALIARAIVISTPVPPDPEPDERNYLVPKEMLDALFDATEEVARNAVPTA